MTGEPARTLLAKSLQAGSCMSCQMVLWPWLQTDPAGRKGVCLLPQMAGLSCASPFLGEFMSGAQARDLGELLSQKQMLLIPTQKPPHSPALPDAACQMAAAESTDSCCWHPTLFSGVGEGPRVVWQSMRCTRATRTLRVCQALR